MAALTAFSRLVFMVPLCFHSLIGWQSPALLTGNPQLYWLVILSLAGWQSPALLAGDVRQRRLKNRRLRPR
jgi:hypothetical protein